MNRQTKALKKLGLVFHKLRGSCKKQAIGGKTYEKMQQDAISPIRHGNLAFNPLGAAKHKRGY